jgi:hypothetical protein
VVHIFDGDMVTSCLSILIPFQMWSTVKRFEVGELVKVQSFLSYSEGDGTIFFTAEVVEKISKAKILIT